MRIKLIICTFIPFLCVGCSNNVNEAVVSSMSYGDASQIESSNTIKESSETPVSDKNKMNSDSYSLWRSEDGYIEFKAYGLWEMRSRNGGDGFYTINKKTYDVDVTFYEDGFYNNNSDGHIEIMNQFLDEITNIIDGDYNMAPDDNSFTVIQEETFGDDKSFDIPYKRGDSIKFIRVK